jgi:diaminopimelate decarboxylase
MFNYHYPFSDILETPFYYYNMDVLRDTLQACQTASAKYGFHVHYAMKANFNPKVLDTIQSYLVLVPIV